jgi:hypothetical protein
MVLRANKSSTANSAGRLAMKRKQTEGISPYTPVPSEKPGLGPGSAGQSGDTQGLPNEPEASNESVEELVEEGQYLEADVVSGVEDAPDADVEEVRTRQLPENDVPLEYDNQD